MHHALNVATVSAYWLSWFLIGAGVLAILARLFHFNSSRPPRSLWLLGALMSGCFVYLIVSIVLYVTEASAGVATILYALLLTISVSYLCTQFRSINLHTLIPFNKLACVVVAVVALDFVAALFIGGALQNGGDSYVHIGRIHDISVNGYNILTPYSQFAIDANYHYNLVYSLYQPLLFLSDISSLDAWRFSSAFFRAVNWLCIYAAASIISRYIAAGRKQQAFPTLVTVFAVVAFGHVFMYSAYPGQVAVVWLYTLILSAVFMIWNSRGGAMGMIISSLLLTFTHPSYALMGGALLSACLVFMFATRVSPGRSIIAIYLISLVFLAIGPLIAYLLSGPLTPSQADISQGIYQNIGPITLRRFDLLIPGSFAIAILSALTAIGTVLLLVGSWKKSRLLFCVIAPTVLLWVFIMYVPGILNLLMIKLPPWLIARFDAVNVFQYVTPFIAAQWVLGYLKTRRSLFIGTACVIGLCTINFIDHWGVYKDMKAVNGQNYTAANALDKLLPDDGAVRLDVLAEPDVGYQTMAVRRVNLLDVGEGHTVPRANPIARSNCSNEIAFQRGAIASLGGDYILWETSSNVPEVIQSGDAITEREVGGFSLGAITGRYAISKVLTESCTLIKNQVFVK